MIRTGTIKLQNVAGIPCKVEYRYDMAMAGVTLIPNANFTAAEVERVTRIMPHTLRAMALSDIERQTSMSCPSPAADRSIFGLSEGR